MTRYACEFGVFCIDAIPNQPQVAHCHSFFVPANKRGNGYGTFLKEFQNKLLSDLCFDYATCTTAESNFRQHSVLRNCGWRIISSFHNRNTDEKTIIWGYEVPK